MDARRLPAPVLAALAGGLGLSALLPAGSAWLVALGAVILLGVPHGALDGEVARPWLRPWFGRGWFGVFALPYLSLSSVVLLAWRDAPLETLAAFLAISAWHFGEEDAGPGRPWEALARGGLPIAIPVLLHPSATAQVLGTAAMVPLAGLPYWLTGAAVLWLPVAAIAVAVLGWERRFGVVAEMAVLACAFVVLPPLAGFALYFVGFHAPRHMAALVANPARAPRVASMRAAALRSLPLTGLTLLLGAGLWRLYPGPLPERLLAVTLQGLAALTVPHLLLDRLVAYAERADAPGHAAALARMWHSRHADPVLQERSP